MPGALPAGVELAFLIAFALIVGSFLNAAIHRLPREGESMHSPRRSRCPSCKHQLTWRENLPVLSWVVLRGRCRWCGWRIPWRYPFVELLTVALWLTAALRTEEGAFGLLAVRCLVLSGLVVATFVDFEFFEIPDEVSLGGLVLAPLLSLVLPSLHDGAWVAQQVSDGWSPGMAVDRAGALASSLAGIAVGGGMLLAIGWIGSRLYGRDAMGLGDVKLLAAGGGFIGPGGAVIALVIGSLVASAAGLANMVRFFCLSQARGRRRGRPRKLGRGLRVARIAGRYIPFGPYLGIGIGIALLK